MTKNNENASKVNNSNHTCTPTERNAASIQLTGNLYRDIQVFGFPRPIQVIASHRRKRNGRGNCLSARIFMPDGREQTAGGRTYEQMLLFVITQLTSYREYLKQN